MKEALGNSAENDEYDTGPSTVADVHWELGVDGHDADRPDLRPGFTPKLREDDEARAASRFQAPEGLPRKKRRLLFGNVNRLIRTARRDWACILKHGALKLEWHQKCRIPEQVLVDAVRFWFQPTMCNIYLGVPNDLGNKMEQISTSPP